MEGNGRVRTRTLSLPLPLGGSTPFTTDLGGREVPAVSGIVVV